MSGFDASAHGRHHDEDAAMPVVRAELNQLQESLMRAMETSYGGDRAPQQHSPANSHGEFDDENSVGAADDYYFGHCRGRGGCHGHGGHRGGARRRGFHSCVHFNDEDFHEIYDHDMEYNGNETPFANHGPFGQHHDNHRCAAYGGHELSHHHHRAEPDNLARIKLSVPKFTGCEDPDAYLEWEEQCDQIFRVHDLSDLRRANLASV
jgi:hypothetical protein